MENNMKEIKKAKALIRLVISKELLNNNNVKQLKDNKYLKEKVENLFKYLRLNIIETATSYKENDIEDFTEDIINGIFSEKEIFCQSKNNIITYKDLLDICGEQYKEEFFIKPINAYKDAASQIEYLYKEAYDVIGLDGIKTVKTAIPRIIENNNFDTKELAKVSDNAYVEAEIINSMISHIHNIDYLNDKDQFCEKLYTSFKQKREDEERKQIYRIKKV